MRFAHEDPELADLVRRYVTPERRYLKLGGNLLRMTQPERDTFLGSLAAAAVDVTPDELTILLDGGWRERKTAAWLIAVTRRTEFRDQIGELLLASEVVFAGRGYCLALAYFGTTADADLLVTYLDRYLRRLDLYYDQALALGALMHIDAELGREHASRFLAPGGLWQQWFEGPPRKENQEPDLTRQLIDELCVFASEATVAAQARRARRPGIKNSDK